MKLQLTRSFQTNTRAVLLAEMLSNLLLVTVNFSLKCYREKVHFENKRIGLVMKVITRYKHDKKTKKRDGTSAFSIFHSNRMLGLVIHHMRTLFTLTGRSGAFGGSPTAATS